MSEVSNVTGEFSVKEKKPLGFEGISYFDEIDKRYIQVDTNKRSVIGSETIHFDPYSGLLYHLITEKKDDRLVRHPMAFSVRTGKYITLEDRDRNPHADTRLAKALSLVAPQYLKWLDKPPGFPETQSLVERIQQTPKIPLNRLAREVKRGDCLLFFDSGAGLHVCESSTVEAITDKPNLKGSYRVYSEGRNPSVDIWWFNQYSSVMKRGKDEKDRIVGGIMPVEHEFVLQKDKQGIWKITPNELEAIKKYAEIEFDPSIEYPLSREEYVVAAALDGMAFDRWGAGIKNIRDNNPSRYEGVTKENLRKAVAILIDRFGDDNFSQALSWVNYQHLFRMHTPQHRTKVMLAQNNAFGDVHSDITGFKKDISGLAKEAIRGVHPVAIDMEKDGYGSVGVGVYNAKSVFGDLDLLDILKTDHPTVYGEFIKQMVELPPIEQGVWYGDSVVNPLSAVRDYYPAVYALIRGDLGGHLPPDNLPGIEY